MIAGTVLCFAKALGEFGATITFVSNIPGETQTISAAIYTYTQRARRRRRSRRLVIVAIVIALAALIASEWLARRAGMRSTAIERCCRSTSNSVGEFSIAAAFETKAASPRCTARRAPASTIVNMIAGLLAPDRGRITFDGIGAVRFGQRAT